jgi:hypothetical protein
MASGAGSGTEPRGDRHFSAAHGAKFFWVVMVSVLVPGSMLIIGGRITHGVAEMEM